MYLLLMGLRNTKNYLTFHFYCAIFSLANIFYFVKFSALPVRNSKKD